MKFRHHRAFSVQMDDTADMRCQNTLPERIVRVTSLHYPGRSVHNR